MDLVETFWRKIFSYHRNIYRRDCLFSNVCFRHQCQKSGGHSWVDSYVGLLFCSMVILSVFVPVACWFFFFFGSSGAWTQGLHFEPLHLTYFCERFFEIRSHVTICPSWLRTTILLISVSRVARITGLKHQHLAPCSFYFYGSVWYSLKSGIMIPPALLFLLSNVLDTPNLFCFQKNLRVVFSFFFLLLYCWFYIYLHIYALFVPSCPHTPSPPNHPLPGRTCSTLLFCNFVDDKT
jgi:hypothetical protein